MNLNYLILTALLLYSAKKGYDNRWTILNMGLDCFLNFKRFLHEKDKPHVDIDKSASQIIVTKLVVRQFDNSDLLNLINEKVDIVDIHLGDSAKLSLPLMSTPLPTSEASFTLIDVHYRLNGKKFISTLPYSQIIQLHKPELKYHCTIEFESASVIQVDGSATELNSDVVGKINRYFEGGRCPGFINCDLGLKKDTTVSDGRETKRSDEVFPLQWMNLGHDIRLKTGDRLILTTSLMETIELNVGG